MKIIYALHMLLCSTIFHFGQSDIIRDGNKLYFADRIVVKYNSTVSQLNKSNNDLLMKIGATQIKPTFRKSVDNTSEAEELNKIFTVQFSSPYNPIFIAKELAKTENIEWAEPYYIYELAIIPNRPEYLIGTLQHLPQIHAEQAWDINIGSQDIIIAIVDTGVDWEHPDLADNIWINTMEIPNNFLDDDGNGFVDDYRGWDFGGEDGNPDNDPKEDKAQHGTFVAGLASAVTNNHIGIASIGYSCKIMSVKTSRNDLGTGFISYGFEGVIYAADNGAHVINCSWGGYSYSYSAQAVIDYAVSKGALVVAAAGNDSSPASFYPASYMGVLSVGGTNFVDQKANWSNYGTTIDVTAPGVNVYSTWQADPYYSLGDGTSYSSPIVAGLAGLVFSQFSNYSPLQVAEQIRVNSDNIDDKNFGFENLFGTGRINAYKALSNTHSKSVRISGIDLIEIGNNNRIFESGENIKIILEITNYLDPISNLVVHLSTDNNNIEILNSGGFVGALNILQKIETDFSFIELEIKENAALNTDVNILVSYSDIDYTDYEWITIPINPTYQIQTSENLSVTFNSSGSIGFDDYPTNLKGKGLIYKEGPNLMFEGALIYGNSANTIVNSARDANTDKDLDFTTIIPISQNSPGIFADKETYTKFSDVSASPSGLGIETEVYTYSFANGLDADFMFIRYAFNNTGNEAINNFYAGQYWDFDMDGNSYEDDMVSFNTENNFGYAFDDDGDPVTTHIGLGLLSEGNTNFFAMDNTGDSNPTISWDGFSDIEKWTALTSGKSYPNSGPNDISLLISGGPYSLDPNSKTEVDFLLAAADNFDGLKATIEKARSKYLNLPTDVANDQNLIIDFKLEQNYPNPFNPTTKIKYSIPVQTTKELSQKNVNLTVYDILGRKVIMLVDQKQNPGSYEIVFNAGDYPSGVYFYKLSSGNYIETKKMLLLK